jgi:hypothetical protein
MGARGRERISDTLSAKGRPLCTFYMLKHKHTDDSEILAVFNHSMAHGFLECIYCVIL